MLHQMFKSVIDQDRAAVVICDTEHTIVYMNPAAVQNYANRGGAELVGKSLLACHNERSNEMIRKIVSWFADSKEHNMIHTFYNEKTCIWWHCGMRTESCSAIMKSMNFVIKKQRKCMILSSR